jgi:hypothetical protein
MACLDGCNHCGSEGVKVRALGAFETCGELFERSGFNANQPSRAQGWFRGAQGCIRWV